MTTQLDADQQSFLDDLEKGEKTVDLIFLDHQIPTRKFGKWLRRRSFLRAIEDMRARMSFRLEQELVRGAELAAIRLHLAVKNDWEPRTPQVQALVNTIKLCNLIVRTPKLKKDAAEAAERLAAAGGGGVRAGVPPQPHAGPGGGAAAAAGEAPSARGEARSGSG